MLILGMWHRDPPAVKPPREARGSAPSYGCRPAVPMRETHGISPPWRVIAAAKALIWESGDGRRSRSANTDSHERFSTSSARLEARGLGRGRGAGAHPHPSVALYLAVGPARSQG